jgi:hypothetical protein
MSDFIKALITERQFRFIMIVKEQQMDNDPRPLQIEINEDKTL